MADEEIDDVEHGEDEGEIEADEAVAEEVEEESVETESVLTLYDPDDFVSGAVNTLDSTIPLDLFEFEHSYGYNCQKYFNLCACDDAVVCWAAGSFITFMDVNTKQIWFRRSTTGGSVGALTSYRKDPNYRIAIAEGREGDRDPIILLYIWPQMEIDAVLRDGTANAYSVLDFSPDGELLASIGKAPDYNLTIWSWKRHRILLRTSAFTFDVNTVMFSPYCPGQLTTAGAAHIKCWKMAETFTGLKLKGELGRFGKTEICDVLGVYPMPDEKILSGCEWGNVLVWEAGLVKMEVTQRGRKPCHKAPVIQFMLSPAGDEVTTIAQDGYVRAWYWDTVEQADPPEEDPYVELNPVAETYIPGCKIMCLKHQKDMNWYAQDGNGGIWTTDLEIDKLECIHRKIMTFHASGVVAMIALRTSPILITAGEDGALHAYNSETHILLARYKFEAAITCVLYPPVDVDATSRIILVGFADGIMRTILVHPERLQDQSTLIEVRVHSALTIHSDDSVHADVIDLISLLKPHSKSLTQITINHQRTLLVTSGQDSTIFMYSLKKGMPFTLKTLGFIQTPNNIAFMTWKPKEERVLLLCGQAGVIIEAELPHVPNKEYSEITTYKQEFVSHEDILIKKYFMRNRPFPTEEDLASIDEEALKRQEEAENENHDDDDEWIGEIQLVENDTMLGTTITWAEYCEEGIWIIQEETGALLLVKPGTNKILKYGPFPGAWSDNITALKFVCEGRYLIVGTNSGYIRVVRMPSDEEDSPEYHQITWLMAQQKLLKKLKGRRLAKEETQPIPRLDFTDNYYLPMHDFYTGAINSFEFSSDGKYFYTCGADGNVFTFKINFTEPLFPTPLVPELKELPKVEKLREPSTLDGELMSHEQVKLKEEFDKMIATANAHKKKVRDQLSELAMEYNKLIKTNRSLPFSQQIDVILDPRPLAAQEKELDEAKALTRRKIAHQLEVSDLALQKMYSRNIIQLDVFPFTLKAIRDPEIMIRPLRQKNLSKAFYDQLEEVYQKMAEASLRGRNLNLFALIEAEKGRAETSAPRTLPRRPSWGPPRVASFLLGLPPRPPHTLKKALRNYRQRLNRHHIQFIEWHEHLSYKPDPHAMPPGAAAALKQAEETIGNRVLKTQPDYVAPQGHNTQLRICLARKEIYDNKREFNEKVLELRKQKVWLVSKMQEIGRRLAEIRAEIPNKLVKQPPPVPQIDENLEFPEKKLEIKPKIVEPMSRRHTSAGKPREGRRSLLYNKQRIRQPRVPRFIPITESRPLIASWELLKPKPDQESTAIEIEIRERRIERHLYEQDMLLVDAKVLVQKFDSRLLQLQRERVRVQEKNQLLELHLYQLHREMSVLNRFEAHEDRLAERVYAKLMQVRSVNDQILDCEQRIEEHKEEKERVDLACQELQRQFKKLVQDNKFADFLRRIFKKKYRRPRDHNEDESSESESSSSSSEEEDEGSLDSRDIGPIRLDPNICPEGCDVDVYNKTYELRNTRHKYEQEMIEQDHLVELLRKDIDAHNKIKRKFSIQLEKRQMDLREFMMEKQSCMNEVEQVVILRYDQIRASALKDCTGPDGLSQTVVFPEKMLTKLRNRVVELQDEIKQQKQRQKVNKTHLFRMNVDLRAMENRATELKAQMRDVLSRKLGKPRRVDKTLDDLLRQLARRHKFSTALTALPQLLKQLTKWRKRHSDLEQKYLTVLNRYSDRLRLAAALQADVLPQKAHKDPTVMPGAYEPEQYQRDVIRLRIISAQQLLQIKALEEEIQGLRLKPLTEIVPPPELSPPDSDRSHIYLQMVPPMARPTTTKYFPITPLGSHSTLVYEVNLMKLLYDCLDMMRVSRDDAEELLHELTRELPKVVSGSKTRFEVVDTLVRKWLLKYGGDPSLYKKQTRAFDALATLADRLLKQHIEAMEGMKPKSHEVMKSLEVALRDVAGDREPLRNRLGPALATLLHTSPGSYLESEETMTMMMTSLVKALVDDEHPLCAESVDQIEIFDIIEDMKDCGITSPEEELEYLIQIAIDSLRAQIIGPEERQQLDKDVEEAIRDSKSND